MASYRMAAALLAFSSLILFGSTFLLAPTQYSGEPTITAIPFETNGIAGEPFLAKSPEGKIYASWIERRDEQAFMQFSSLSGDGWSAPQEIASGSNWFVNWADVPSITATSGGRMMAHWLERLGEGRYAYGVRYAVSSDEGQTWSGAEWLHGDRSETEHGFVSVEPTPNGYLAVWLDGNGYGTGRQEMAVHSRLVGFDGLLGDEAVVDSRTCDCCPTTLTRLGDGRLLTLYRDRSDEEIRDIMGSFWSNGSWSEPELIHDDGWKIEACPVNGPAVHALDQQFVASWFTVASGAPALHALFSSEDGTEFGKPMRLDLGHPVGRVSTRMMSSTEAAALWIEGSGSETNGLLLRTIATDGSMSDVIQVSPISEGRSSGYPRLESDGSSLIAIWTVSSDPATIKTARIEWK